MSEHYVHAWWPQRTEGASEPLGLELQMIESCHVGAGTETRELCNSTSTLPLTSESYLQPNFYIYLFIWGWEMHI